ncbi:hypothetical protein [Bacillus sp. REN3]|uniref:hypothetical protein n=1 Tax=Bacillus sp. REN3 TaxID=2802440 RepID=UPI001AEEA790|nr:hypothetical protein [Bacillus sp. REN3]
MLGKKILLELQEFVDQHLIIQLCEKSAEPDYVLESISQFEIESFIKQKRKPTLQKVLFDFIDRKGATDAEIYKKAGIDRRHFSKIRSNPEYRPGKNTMIALALALELNKKETDKLLSSAGYSLSDSELFDLVIQFCIEKKIYEIIQVNQALDYFSLKPIGGVS